MTEIPPEIENSSSTPPRSKNLFIRRLGIAAAILFFLATGLVFLFISVAPDFLGAELQKQVQGHPSIQQEFGELKKCSFSYSATISNGRPETLVFDVEGDKDKGQLIVVQPSNYGTTYDLKTMIIRKYDGREIPLSN